MRRWMLVLSLLGLVLLQRVPAAAKDAAASLAPRVAIFEMFADPN